MTLLKIKPGMLSLLDDASWIGDWSSKVPDKEFQKTIFPSPEYPSNLVLKSKADSVDLIRIRHFLNESLKSSKGNVGTIITGSKTTTTRLESHEILTAWFDIYSRRKKK